jgi:DNA-binding CsgD family transcriptional regulator
MGNPSERRIRWLLASVGAGCFALLLLLEAVTEGDAVSPVDFVVDALTLLLTIGAAVGVALLAQRIHAQHEEKTALLRDLKIARAEGDAWRAKVRSHLSGLKAGMDRQFEEWGMTAAEREVGLLILKGLSHKEIASLRATTEATVRQQAQAIYRKANLPGKTAFCAYFLEDLFAPDVTTDGHSTAAGEAPAPAEAQQPPGARVRREAPGRVVVSS